ncbi:MAG: glycosyltransferase [Acidobacteriia bacterium]|nr:glycosyltransferase [Terriglobia bacterium]
MPPVSLIVAVLSLGIWVYLLAGRGGYWRVRRFDADGEAAEAPREWPAVVAIVPARNEAENVARTIRALLRQDYPGRLAIVLVDDHSEDGTAEVARQAARECGGAERVRVHAAAALPEGWTGKVWAMAQGVASGAEPAPGFYWFTDADVVPAPETLRRLVCRAECDALDLASLMVFLQTRTFAERALIPAFLFFFLQLYPPRWIAEPRAHTAGAAGGCILLRRAALERIGGFQAIRGEVIDDCALARAVKQSGGRIWMGLSRASVSVRVYARFREIEQMIARTAFTQLRYSALQLGGAVAGLLVTYVAPVILALGAHGPARFVALGAWLLMAASFAPALRFYRQSLLWAPLLPLMALFYLAATLDSAGRYWLGRGGEWKGRAQAPHPG